MPLPYTFTNSVYPAGYWGEDDGNAKNTFSIDQVYSYGVTINGTVNAAGDTVTLTYPADAVGNFPAGDPSGHAGQPYAGATVTLTATNFDNSGQIEFVSNSLPPGETAVKNYRYVLSNSQMYGNPPPPGQTRTVFTADDAALGSYDQSQAPAPCFTTGTRIRVLADGVLGEVAVEDLRIGDQAVTASGRVRQIKWIGHRNVDRRHLKSEMPVRIAAHAFGADLPNRDLMLSPGHPVLVGADDAGAGGYLVPIMCLINGTTIERVSVDEVTYWHIELDEHDILLAEGLPAESYLDWGDRPFFSEAPEHALMNPDFVVPGLAGRCRPVAADGPVVDAERRRLDAVFASRLFAASAWPREDAAASAF